MKRASWWMALALFVALGGAHCTPAPAAPSEPTPAELWAYMARSQGAAYIAARDGLLESGAARKILEAKLADPDWRVQAVARAGLERLSQPQVYVEYDAHLAGGLKRVYMFEPGPLQAVVQLFSRPRTPSSSPPPKSGYDAAAVPFLLETLAKGAAPPPGWHSTGEAAAQLYSQVAQCYAALALGRLADPRGIAPLLDVMRTGEFSELKEYAAVGLSWTGRADVIPPLRNALQDPDPKVRAGAAGGLGQLLTTPEDPDLVRLAADDPDPGVRFAASAALLDIRSRLRNTEQGGPKMPNP